MTDAKTGRVFFLFRVASSVYNLPQSEDLAEIHARVHALRITKSLMANDHMPSSWRHSGGLPTPNNT